MDAVTVRMPGIVASAAALQQAADAEKGDARLVSLAFAVNRLQTSADDADSSLGAAMKNNAAGATSQALATASAAMKAAVAKLLDDGKALLAGQDAASLAADHAAAIKQVDATWRADERRTRAAVAGADRRLQRQSADEAGDRRRCAGDRVRAAIRRRARHLRPARRPDARHARTRRRQFRRRPPRRRPQGRNRPDRRRRRKLQAPRGGESAAPKPKRRCAASRRNPPPKPEPPPSANALRPNRRRRSARWPPD